MNKLAIALQGIGFGSKLIALQGFGEQVPAAEDDDPGGIVVRPVLEVLRKKRDRRRDTDDDAIFMFLLS